MDSEAFTQAIGIGGLVMFVIGLAVGAYFGRHGWDCTKLLTIIAVQTVLALLIGMVCNSMFIAGIWVISSVALEWAVAIAAITCHREPSARLAGTY